MSNQRILFERMNYRFALSENHNWTDILSQASMLIIDDIDHSLKNDVANTWGNIIDLALNMNVHVIVSSTTMPQRVASKVVGFVTDWCENNSWVLLALEV